MAPNRMNVKEILDFIKRNSSKMKYNRTTYQSHNTASCGLFCLYFLHKICRSEGLDELSISNKTHNEKIVVIFVNCYLKLRSLDVFNKKNQNCVKFK